MPDDLLKKLPKFGKINFGTAENLMIVKINKGQCTQEVKG